MTSSMHGFLSYSISYMESDSNSKEWSRDCLAPRERPLGSLSPPSGDSSILFNLQFKISDSSNLRDFNFSLPSILPFICFSHRTISQYSRIFNRIASHFHSRVDFQLSNLFSLTISQSNFRTRFLSLQRTEC